MLNYAEFNHLLNFSLVYQILKNFLKFNILHSGFNKEATKSTFDKNQRRYNWQLRIFELQ